MPQLSHLYFHSPCYDGIASAVVVSNFLENNMNWGTPELHCVNYHLRNSWLKDQLERPCAVVDFLYHPSCDFWSDHHQTSFLSQAAEDDYAGKSSDSHFVYDRTADSCAGLLWRHLKEAFDFREEQYRELVQWAEKIDAARYESVGEAIQGDAPALQIASSLVLADEEYCKRLVFALRTDSLESVAEMKEVSRRVKEVRSKTGAGLKRMENAIKLLERDIAVFDVDTEGTMINRYAPFYFFPDSRYSVGILHYADRVKITTMRNPWREFECVNLGEVCGHHAGGGHQRVGSIMLSGDRRSQASEIVNEIIEEIHRKESAVDD